MRYPMDKVITTTHLHVTLMLIFLGSNLVINTQNLVMRDPLTETMTWVAAEIFGIMVKAGSCQFAFLFGWVSEETLEDTANRETMRLVVLRMTLKLLLNEWRFENIRENRSNRLVLWLIET